MPQNSNVTEPPYKPGALKFVRLQNFMCHPNFELPFGPSVNFIIGPNGSGKSAILTALVVALGGRATTTNRAKRMNEFIKYGERWAKITIVLHNYEKVTDKHFGFKPDDYGKWITVEKTIYRDEPAKLAIKNDAGKKVSERKAELDEMIDHFGILINNPICILNQEISKTFLHSKKPEDKFDLFMKATMLEQIEQDYQAAETSHKQWSETNDKNSIAFMLLDKEYQACLEKSSFLQNSAKLKDRQQELKSELMLSYCKEYEKCVKELDKKLESIKKNIREAMKKVDDRNEKIRKFDEEIQVLQGKMEIVNTQLDESKAKIRVIRDLETTNKTNQVQFTSKIDTAKRNIARTEKDILDLEKEIENKKKELRAQNALDNDSEQRKLDIEALEKELKYDQDKEKNLRLHTDQLNNSMTSLRSEMQAAGFAKSECRTKITAAEANLNRLQNGQKHALRRYGDYVLRIREEIDRAYDQGRFKHKPLGPLGYYIKIKSPVIAAPLECHLKRNAHAFACDNQQDMVTMQNIIRKLAAQSRDFKAPTLITRPFVRRHDVSRHKAQHSTYKCFLDYLEIEEDAVFNALCDRCFLESVLFIEDYFDAEALMIDERRVPPNTRIAMTKCCQVMHPKTPKGGYKSYTNNPAQCNNLFTDSNVSFIKEKELEIRKLKANLQQAEEAYKNLENSMTVQRREYDANAAEIRKLISDMRTKEEKLLMLKTTVSVRPQVLAGLEEELTEHKNRVETSKLVIENCKENLAMLHKELKDILREKTEVDQKIQLRTDKNQELCQVIEETKKSKIDAINVIKSCEATIEARNKEQTDTESDLEETRQILARSLQRLTDDDRNTSKPIRKVSEINAELTKIQDQLRIEAEEMQDPHEVIEKLQKRKREIENLNDLKELNLLNCTLASKSLSQRKEGVDVLRRNTMGAVGTTFTAVMRSNNMDGKLLINSNDVYEMGELVKKGRTLEMRIDTHYTPTQRLSTAYDNDNNTGRRESRSQPSLTAPAAGALHSRSKRARVDRNQSVQEKENEIKMTDARSLSGGERSFSTVAFVLSLWHHCSSPFKLMDEIDVFMDMVTRRVSYNALVRFAQISEDRGQHIFFSPLELPKIDDSNHIVRVFEMPAIIRKRPHSQLQLDQGGDEQEAGV